MTDEQRKKIEELEASLKHTEGLLKDTEGLLYDLSKEKGRIMGKIEQLETVRQKTLRKLEDLKKQ